MGFRIRRSRLGGMERACDGGSLGPVNKAGEEPKIVGDDGGTSGGNGGGDDQCAVFFHSGLDGGVKSRTIAKKTRERVIRKRKQRTAGWRAGGRVEEGRMEGGMKGGMKGVATDVPNRKGGQTWRRKHPDSGRGGSEYPRW